MKYYLITAFLLISIDLFSQDWNLANKIAASDRAEMDQFGWSVAIDGDYAAVCAVGNDTDENNMNPLPSESPGAVFIFEKNTSGDWTQTQKIVASDRMTGSTHWFGNSLSISGSTMVVGTYESEKVFVFDRGSDGIWQETQILTSPNTTSSDSFGEEVAISGDYIIIAAETDRLGPNMPSQGTAYIFERNSSGTWIEKQLIYAADTGSSLDFFGSSVGISGNYAIVGAKQEDEDENGLNFVDNAGSAYIFERNSVGNWVQVQKIVESTNREDSDLFGFRVDIDNNRIVVSTFSENTDENSENYGYNTGAAFVYERDSGGNWNFVQKLVSSQRASSTNFGYHASISGDFISVSAYTEDGGAGVGYIFGRDSNNFWSEQQQLIAPVRFQDDYVGYSTAISGGSVVYGALGEDEDSNETNFINFAGSAYIFEYSGNLSVDDIDWNNSLSLYPNPVSDVVNFISKDRIVDEVKLFSSQGQLIKTLKSENIESLDISHLSNGVYLIQTKSGQDTSTFKIIKK
ncbi:T9SS type A sorting domain-containing protein [Winogradskyella sp. SYSU M77433]|uniref:T9SS type A sorting domain-containing protein n=1 Tax=Winogradskyella sp. SYSU M77433 TaxID=3042722 RepID=UPI002480B6A1|nr:T9SS type A sorting domain-containing protein [Winogradskyella sp. SYSU M77433]MDH7911366.1 T9SS type A sorting domain-containing protein [Winogradskyella sp. SYSU M77433]